MAVSLCCEFRHSSHGETVCQTVCYTVRSHFNFCLYVRSLYEAPLHSPSRLSIRQLDLCLNLGMSYSVIDGMVVCPLVLLTVYTSHVSLALYRNHNHRLVVSECPYITLVYICCAGCPASFTYIPSVNGCYKVVTRALNWTAAELNCLSLYPDTHLVVINDAQEQSAVAGILSSTGL